MDFFRFLLSKRFLKHFAASVLIMAVLIGITLVFLGVYTSHGDNFTVPDFSGKTVDQVNTNPDNADFDFVVIDSVFYPEKIMGTVINQDPFPGSKVKKGRKIYLTVVSSIPEKTSMPDLKFLTLRQALSVLESCGLIVGNLEYIRTFDADAVQQQYLDGKIVRPGTRIDKGTRIDLVVGMGSKGQALPAKSGNDSVRADSI
jgi:eukaryotic-like serine/threonine-protein kinase